MMFAPVLAVLAALIVGSAMPGVRLTAPDTLDCWVASIEQEHTGFGDDVHASRYQLLRATMARAEVLLRRDAVINALPDLRAQARRFIGLPVHGGAPMSGSVRVGLHRRSVWGPGCSLDQGRADYLSFASLSVSFNDLTPLQHLLSSPAELEDGGHVTLPEVTGYADGAPIYGHRLVILTPSGLAPFVPVTVREHLREWEGRLDTLVRQGGGTVIAEQLAGLRAHRQRLSARQLDVPLRLSTQSVSDQLWWYAPEDEADGALRVRINPELWRDTHEGDVRVITFEVFLNNEGDELTSALEQWTAQLPIGAWRVLMSPRR